MKPIKNCFLIIILSCLVIFKSFGQIHSIGVHIGPNLSEISWEDVDTNTKIKAGIIGGVNYQLTFSKSQIAEVNLIYFQQGFISKSTFNDNMGNHAGTSKVIFGYDYIGVPLKYGLSFGKKINIIPKIGLVPSFLISAKTKADIVEDGRIIGQDIIDVKDKVTKFDLAGLIEICLEYPFTNNFSIFSSASYRYSLTSFSNENYFNGLNMRHYNYSLLVGIKYVLNIRTNKLSGI